MKSGIYEVERLLPECSRDGSSHLGIQAKTVILPVYTIWKGAFTSTYFALSYFQKESNCNSPTC